jgi:antitoxin (DNA-binding transcriptional repressor) of toxin-antitoxin stability system
MQISIHQAQTCLLELATRAAQGEKIIIAHDNGVYVELIPYLPKPSYRQAGLLKHKAVIIDPNWSAPSDEITQEFYPQ